MSESFTVSKIRPLVADLMSIRPLVYWVDLLITASIAWGGLAGATIVDAWGLRIALIFVSAFAFLRAVLFIHEIAHFRRDAMKSFRVAWNLIIGIPMALPSLMYVGTHVDHHKRKLYGTIADPEYLPLAHLARWRLVLFVLETLIVPALLVLRFGVLTPLGWLIPPLRRLVVERASALVINPSYKRRMPRDGDRWRWLSLEVGCLAWIVFVAWMLREGRLSWNALGCWYAVTALVALTNQVRTLAAHLYENAGEAMSTEEQLLDSVNVRGLPFLTELVFPVGLKYHGLHHFLPDMPYHGLPAAHRRLMSELPEGSPYRRSEHPSFFGLVRRLWRAEPRGAFPSVWNNARD